MASYYVPGATPASLPLTYPTTTFQPTFTPAPAATFPSTTPSSLPYTFPLSYPSPAVPPFGSDPSPDFSSLRYPDPTALTGVPPFPSYGSSTTAAAFPAVPLAGSPAPSPSYYPNSPQVSRASPPISPPVTRSPSAAHSLPP
eukprot:RCo041585